jgi:hypothetical protein
MLNVARATMPFGNIPAEMAPIVTPATEAPNMPRAMSMPPEIDDARTIAWLTAKTAQAVIAHAAALNKSLMFFPTCPTA